jgi:hypothetical protein
VQVLHIQHDKESTGRLTYVKFSLKLDFCFLTVHSSACYVGGQTSFQYNSYMEDHSHILVIYCMSLWEIKA